MVDLTKFKNNEELVDRYFYCVEQLENNNLNESLKEDLEEEKNILSRVVFEEYKNAKIRLKKYWGY